MSYVTVPQSPMLNQMTIDEMLSGIFRDGITRLNIANTTTYNKKYVEVDEKVIDDCIWALKVFNEKYSRLREVERHSLYHQFFIPKNSGGLREINAPYPELSQALTELKTIFETKFFALYHTSAFAYVKQRSTIDAVKKHQQNNSHWFLKTDFSNFFGNTTMEFTMNMLSKIYPFDSVITAWGGREELTKALDLCFLDGGLPMGTPISPMLTNLIMIPIDHKIFNDLTHGEGFEGQHFVYTRYADDMLISSYKPFMFKDMVRYINSVLSEFHAPYELKPSKTRYGSRNGSNWNLGLMLNKDNEITIGHAKKKSMRAMINNYILDKLHNKSWLIDDVQKMSGVLSYYRTVEPEYVDAVIDGYSKKYSVDFNKMVKADLSL